jgi:DNA-binding response OmpR family regulator
LGEKVDTILVVNNTACVRKFLVATLKTASFVVLDAKSELRALNVADNYADRIDLLLADSKLLGASCPSLADALKRTRPNIAVMLTCGDILISSCGCALILNPFSPVNLLEMINVVLHQADESQGIRRFTAGSGG